MYHLENYQKVQKVAETLDVTEARQYRERGLIHISDNAYRFFMAMESEGLKLINNNKLKEQKQKFGYGGEEHIEKQPGA